MIYIYNIYISFINSRQEIATRKKGEGVGGGSELWSIKMNMHIPVSLRRFC